jgi:hypothetical protein
VNGEQTELIGREAMGEDRHESDLNAPVEWAGLPVFHPAPERNIQLVVTCESEEDRDALIARLGLVIAKKTGKTWSAWWPPREREDLAALRFDFDAPDQGEDEPPDPHLRAAANGYGRDIEEDGGL